MDDALPLVSFRTTEQIERAALDLLALLCPDCIEEPQPVPILDIIQYDLEQHFGIGFFLADLPYDVEAVTRPPRGDLPARIEMQPHIFSRLERDEGRSRFTAGHEVGHAILHISEIDIDLVHGAETGLYRTTALPPGRNPERQANLFASRLLMPTAAVLKVLTSTRNPNARFVAGTFSVSPSAAEVRMGELGYR